MGRPVGRSTGRPEPVLPLRPTIRPDHTRSAGSLDGLQKATDRSPLCAAFKKPAEPPGPAWWRATHSCAIYRHCWTHCEHLAPSAAASAGALEEIVVDESNLLQAAKLQIRQGLRHDFVL